MNNNPPSYDTLYTHQPQYHYQLNYLQPNYTAPNGLPIGSPIGSPNGSPNGVPKYIYTADHTIVQPVHNTYQSYTPLVKKDNYNCCILL